MWLRCQIGSNKPVGEPEGQDVLRRLLPEEVVDPEDLLLLEDPVQLLVERPDEARSVPNGFSMMIRLRATRSASLRICTTSSAAFGGTLK